MVTKFSNYKHAAPGKNSQLAITKYAEVTEQNTKLMWVRGGIILTEKNPPSSGLSKPYSTLTDAGHPCLQQRPTRREQKSPPQ